MKPHEAEVLDALQAVLKVIEMTYGHDDEGKRLDDDEPEASAADIVEALCNIEPLVASAADAVASATLKLAARTRGLSESKRLGLLRDVSQALFNKTESWTDHGVIGGKIAYLLHAIAFKGCIDLYTNQEHAFLDLLRETFDADHRVWRFIDIDP